ncbi:hypothetical protein L6164_000783 [Bauhinia variegata]|uniref:Uncharacterized protein n=1 Tax=Bauhinia variegata TaxID=167791 RepID=A0ACB9Q9R6_BAUVA|nr:hypothetical protein L6164_000783 [Bauhinia variegata]
MKLVWSPETASKAYIDTVKSCKSFNESGVAELLSATAAGWNAKLIVESWSSGGLINASVGLAVAARNTGGRHVCIVSDDRSRLEYTKAMSEMGFSPEVVIGVAETVMAGLEGLDFLVVDSKRKDFARVLSVAKVGSRGAVLACKNAWQRNASGFRWNVVLERGTRVVRSVFLPVGKGLDIAYIGSKNGSATSKKVPKPRRWIKHTDQKSGEVHIFRE